MRTRIGGGHRIDAVGAALAAKPDRRGLRRGAVGSLGVALAAGAPARAAACKKVDRTCDRDGDCCDGAECRNKRCTCKAGRDERGGTCFRLDSDERRRGGCDTPCAAGKTCCGGACVDPAADPANCGACGVACPESEACRFGGVCASCFPRTGCAGACVDLTADRDNCGATGAECEGIDEVCGNGFRRACNLLAGERPCVTVRCAPGRSCIDGECELA